MGSVSQVQQSSTCFVHGALNLLDSVQGENGPTLDSFHSDQLRYPRRAQLINQGVVGYPILGLKSRGFSFL